MLKAVIFDLNGVFIQGPYFSDLFCGRFGVDRPEFMAALKDTMAIIRRPNAPTAFTVWQPHLTEWNITLNEQEFYAFWFGSERLVPELIVLAGDLQTQGLRVLIASNNFRERAASYATRFPELSTAVDSIYYSWETGLVKPDPRVFTTILEREHLQPAETIYFDDVEENIRVAAGLGIKAYPFVDAQTTRTIIQRERHASTNA